VLWMTLLLIMTHLLAQTPDSIECPPDTLKVDFVSPVTGLRKVACTKKINGQNVPQIEYNFDKSGQLAPGKSSAVFGAVNLPGTEEKKAPISQEKISSALKHVLKILSRQTLNDGLVTFRVNTCEANPIEWIKMAMTKQPKTFSYRFKEGCDVDGTFTAAFEKEFPINMNLKNLYDFNQTQMNVIQKMSKGQKGVRYHFEAVTGTLKSPSEMVEFKARYEIEFNIFNGEPLEETQNGMLTITKVNDKAVLIEEKLLYQ
jgi:hypothetical protein